MGFGSYLNDNNVAHLRCYPLNRDIERHVTYVLSHVVYIIFWSELSCWSEEVGSVDRMIDERLDEGGLNLLVVWKGE
jgi:hypothetical protein